MTNDELLAGFLDGTLSQDQVLEFKARRAADAAFAAETEDMITVEGLLARSTPDTVAPAGFLSSVEASVATKIAAGTAGAIGLGHLLSNVWAWVIGTGAVVVGGGAVYLAVNSSTPTPTQSTATTSPVSERKSAPAVAAPVPSPVSEPQTRITTSTSNTRIPKPTTATQPRVSAPPSTTSATAEANSPNSVLAALEADYAQCAAQSNAVKCAQIALQIGQQYMQRNNTDKATSYLTKALAHARSGRVVQYQVTALGSLGIVAKDAGYTVQARQYLTSAIELAQSNGLEHSQYSTVLASLP